MFAFRCLLAVMFVALFAYTAVTITNHGMNLIPVFFADMAKMAWPGQFNADFMGFLILSALWTAWRNRFTPAGLALACVAFFGGIMFLTPYLFYLSFQSDGDIRKVLLGKHYASSGDV